MQYICKTDQLTTLTPEGFGSENAPDLTIGGGTQPVTPPQPPPPPPPPPPRLPNPISDWIDSPCRSDSKYRLLESGHIEVTGLGIPKLSNWPGMMNNDLKTLIETTAYSVGISPALLAAIVAIESGGDTNKRNGDKIGLTQIDFEMAKLISGDSDIREDAVFHPSWNLTIGSKYMLQCLINERNNLIGAIARYGSGSVGCDTKCSPDIWGVWTDRCDYIDDIIKALNTAVDKGYDGVTVVDYSTFIDDTESNKTDTIVTVATIGIAAIAAYIGYSAIKKR